MEKAVEYLRYSSDKQTELSIEGQHRACLDFAKRKGLKIIDSYIDRALSGKVDNRPEFQRLIADSASSRFSAVIVYDNTRFARNRYDAAFYKKRLKDNNVKLYYATQTQIDGPEGIILDSVMEGLAEYFSEKLAIDVTRGMRENALKGRSVGGTRSLGYRTGTDKTYIIDETEAEIVRQIFQLY